MRHHRRGRDGRRRRRAGDVLLACQPVGSNVTRLIQLAQTFPTTRFSTVEADDAGAIRALAQASASAAGVTVEVFLDLRHWPTPHWFVEPGPHADELYRVLVASHGQPDGPGGLHAYDGHLHQANLAERTEKWKAAFAAVEALREGLSTKASRYRGSSRVARRRSRRMPDGPASKGVRGPASCGMRGTRPRCLTSSSCRQRRCSLACSASRVERGSAWTSATRPSPPKGRPRATAHQPTARRRDVRGAQRRAPRVRNAPRCGIAVGEFALRDALARLPHRRAALGSMRHHRRTGHRPLAHSRPRPTADRVAARLQCGTREHSPVVCWRRAALCSSSPASSRGRPAGSRSASARCTSPRPIPRGCSWRAASRCSRGQPSRWSAPTSAPL